MLKESLKMSWQNIKSNKMRTFLTTLGIIIGVTAIIALITVLKGATGEVSEQFNALGAGKMNAVIMGNAVKKGLTEADLQTIRNLEYVDGVDPSLSFISRVYHKGTYSRDVTIQGRSDRYFSGPSQVGLGRVLKPFDMERSARVAIIDSNVRSALFPKGSPLGQTVEIHGISFTVIGVLDTENTEDVMIAMSAMQSGSSGQVIIPYPAAMQLTGAATVNNITVYTRDTAMMDETVRQVEATLDAMFNYRDNAYNIINLDSLLNVMNSLTAMMTSLLVGIASIALLVGGIGIMNMMLVSVTERTAEIGLRKALGAKPWLIQLQFLMEAIMLSVMGGIIGILLGNAISLAVCQVIGIPFAVSLPAISLGFFFSASMGVIFGWTPARKASKLNPIDALRAA